MLLYNVGGGLPPARIFTIGFVYKCTVHTQIEFHTFCVSYRQNRSVWSTPEFGTPADTLNMFFFGHSDTQICWVGHDEILNMDVMSVGMHSNRSKKKRYLRSEKSPSPHELPLESVG